MPRFLPFLLFMTVAVAGIAPSGCMRGDPRASPIEAANPGSLARWRMKNADRIKPDEWREFDAALQEIRLRVMANREASGSEAIEAAMCGRVNGKTFREVIVLGYDNRLARLDPVRGELKSALDTNALLVTRPGDGSSAKYLDGLRERQEERLRKADAEIDSTEQRLAEIGGPAWAAKIAERKKTAARTVSTPALSREEALAEIRKLIFEQKGAATFKYGAWPVKLDHDGTQLPVEERADFMARRAAAPANGHTVIAVRLKERWWIFDDRAGLPQLGRAVTANLRKDDLENLAKAWADLQAELWARKKAWDEAEQAK